MAENNDVRNFDYLQETLRLHPGTTEFRLCLTAMEKYAEPWWLNGKAEDLAAKQIKEPVLLIPFRTFKKGIESVVGRPLKLKEVSKASKNLIREFEEKYLVYCQENQE